MNWERKIEIELKLGRFISWHDISKFCTDLESLLQELSTFAKEHPQEALPLFDLFIAGCLEKVNEVDDSGGQMGGFIDGLACAWSRCCHDAGIPGEDFFQRIEHWMKVDSNDYLSDLKTKVIPSLSKAYQETLEAELKSQIQSGDSRDAIRTLKALYAQTQNATALIALGEKHGLNQNDCRVLAGFFLEKEEPDQALKWADQGLGLKQDLSLEEYELKELRRKILIQSGRRSDAVADAWKEFEAVPSIHSFEAVLASAESSDHDELKAKALPLFDRAELGPAAVALCKLQELDRLIARLSNVEDAALQSLFYGEAIPIAEALAKEHPKAAARLYIAQALAILKKNRSRAYPQAHDYLEEAKRLLKQSGDMQPWEALASQIRSEHRFNSAFMPGFERIAADKDAPRKPTFQERIANRLPGGSEEE